MIITDIEQGDFVDFGSYGNFYVSNPRHNEHEYWVTRTEADRFSRHSEGWVIKKNLARLIVEKAWEANLEPGMMNMTFESKTQEFSTDRYLPPKFRKGGEDAYKHKGYPKVKIERVGHVNHLWTKKINRNFEWKGEWVCSICGATVRSKSAPLPDAQVDQMGSPSINTLLPIGGKTVVEDIKKLEGGAYPAITLEEGVRRLKSIGWDEIPGTREVLRDGAEYAEFIWTGEPDLGAQTGWIQRRINEMNQARIPQVVRGKSIRDTYWTVQHGGRNHRDEQDDDKSIIGIRFEAKMNKFESKVIKMAEQTDFVAGTAIMMGIGWSPAPGNRKDFEDGVSRVYEYTGTDDPIPPYEVSFGSFARYDEWRKRQSQKIESALSGIEGWVHGWPVTGRVEIWYPNKMEQMEGKLAKFGKEQLPPCYFNLGFVAKRIFSQAVMSGQLPETKPDWESVNQRERICIAVSLNAVGITKMEGPPQTVAKVNTYVNDVNTGQKENILQRVSRTGHALFEDGEKCPKCGSTKIETAGDSVNCQMCGDSYKKKVVQKEEFPFDPRALELFQKDLQNLLSMHGRGDFGQTDWAGIQSDLDIIKGHIERGVSSAMDLIGFRYKYKDTYIRGYLDIPNAFPNLSKYFP